VNTSVFFYFYKQT